MILLTIGLLWQAALTGYTFSLAGNAADEAARAGAVGGGSACADAARRTLPGNWQGAEISCRADGSCTGRRYGSASRPSSPAPRTSRSRSPATARPSTNGATDDHGTASGRGRRGPRGARGPREPVVDYRPGPGRRSAPDHRNGTGPAERSRTCGRRGSRTGSLPHGAGRPGRGGVRGRGSGPGRPYGLRRAHRARLPHRPRAPYRLC
nr:hypothetical protein [Streptomyces tsukubensis]